MAKTKSAPLYGGAQMLAAPAAKRQRQQVRVSREDEATTPLLPDCTPLPRLVTVNEDLPPCLLAALHSRHQPYIDNGLRVLTVRNLAHAAADTLAQLLPRLSAVRELIFVGGEEGAINRLLEQLPMLPNLGLAKLRRLMLRDVKISGAVAGEALAWLLAAVDPETVVLDNVFAGGDDAPALDAYTSYTWPPRARILIARNMRCHALRVLLHKAPEVVESIVIDNGDTPLLGIDCETVKCLAVVMLSMSYVRHIEVRGRVAVDAAALHALYLSADLHHDAFPEVLQHVAVHGLVSAADGGLITPAERDEEVGWAINSMHQEVHVTADFYQPE